MKYAKAIRAALIVTALLLQVSVAAADPPLLTRDGRKISGKVIADDGIKLTVKLANGTTTELRYEDIRPRTMYRLLAGKAAKNDARAQLSVARYALGAGLLGAAQKHFALAAKADPLWRDEAERGIAKVRERQASAYLGRARKALEKKRYKEAERDLLEVLHNYPESKAADEAVTLHAGILEEAEKRLEQELAAEKAKHDEKLMRRLAPLYDEFQHAVNDTRKALADHTRRSAKIRKLQESLRHAKRIKSRLAALEKQHDGHGSHEALEELERRTRSLEYGTLIHLANIHRGEQSFRRANEWIDRAIALDPQNRRAHYVKARIATEEAYYSDVGFKRGRSKKRSSLDRK